MKKLNTAIARMNILFLRLKKKENSRKEAPIYCRITIDGDRAEWSTGIFCTAADWNIRHHRLRQGSELAEAHNQTLLQLESRLRVIKNELERTQVPYGAELIRKIANKKAQADAPVVTLTGLILMYRKYKEGTIGKPGGIIKDTYRSYNGRLKLVAEFIKGGDLPVSDIDKQFGQRFLFWLRGKGLSQAYTYKTFTLLTEVLNYAVMEKLINNNELRYVKIKYEKPDKTIHLTQDAVDKIAAYRFQSEKLNRVKDMFLMQCYCGVSYSDLPQINRESVYTESGYRWIGIRRKKTNIRAIILLNDAAETILLKYNYALPIISNQKYNSYLKEVAGILEIPINLVTNSGRKTFGQMHLNNGVTYEVVARMMGHKNSRTTEEYYAKIGEERIKKEVLGTVNKHMKMHDEVAI